MHMEKASSGEGVQGHRGNHRARSTDIPLNKMGQTELVENRLNRHWSLYRKKCVEADHFTLKQKVKKKISVIKNLWNACLDTGVH